MNGSLQHRSQALTRTYLRSTHLAYGLLAFAIIVCAAMLLLPFPFYWLPFAFVAVAIFVVGTFKYPYFGFFLYLIIFFMNPNEIFPFLEHFTFPYEKVVAFLVIGSLLLHIAVVQKKFKIYYLDVALASFVLVAFLSILVAVDLQTAYDQWQRFFRMFIVYLLFSRIVKTQNQLKAIVILFIISIGFLAISSTIQYYRGEYEVHQGIERLHSFGGGLIDPNTLATTLVLGMPFMYYMARAHRSLLLKLFMFALMGACIWTVILTGSRGGMVGTIATLGLITWHSRHKVLGFIVALMVIAVVGVFMPQQYQNRFMTIFHVGAHDKYGAGASAYGRINGFILGWKYFLKDPVLGIGIANFGLYHHREVGGDWTDAHNLIGKLVGELGSLGIITFFWFITRFAKTIKSVRRAYWNTDWKADFLYWLSEAIKIGLIMLFVQGTFGHNLYRENWYFFAAFIVTAAKLVNQRIEAERPAKVEAAPALEVNPGQ